MRKFISFLSLVAVVLSTVSPLYAGDSSEGVRVSVINDTPPATDYMVDSHAEVVQDQYGNLHAVWKDSRDFENPSKLYYSTRKAGSTEWGQNVLLSTDENYSQYPSLHICKDTLVVASSMYSTVHNSFFAYLSESKDLGKTWSITRLNLPATKVTGGEEIQLEDMLLAGPPRFRNTAVSSTDSCTFFAAFSLYEGNTGNFRIYETRFDPLTGEWKDLKRVSKETSPFIDEISVDVEYSKKTGIVTTWTTLDSGNTERITDVYSKSGRVINKIYSGFHGDYSVDVDQIFLPNGDRLYGWATVDAANSSSEIQLLRIDPYGTQNLTVIEGGPDNYQGAVELYVRESGVIEAYWQTYLNSVGKLVRARSTDGINWVSPELVYNTNSRDTKLGLDLVKTDFGVGMSIYSAGQVLFVEIDD
ncbi:exo-alpha-sialidase [Candidatus Nomurabacteria bacterium]|uniref:Exo-alpha-sialidase n=1 Tax=Candidatus Dojkabacteria bacterium TaxID=2099670 RepID=A0A955KX28_9BACT|nr:exo-alpha-sialidase [Candidatus Dojkabacteria bacterium]MCB9790395.1 exo-alpha-sialidase [Candidatus Nomurabacteria bacterium]MCB9803683.1 exo-alpha-sialidase [Candidatus Nomurabacteria bacterium]